MRKFVYISVVFFVLLGLYILGSEKYLFDEALYGFGERNDGAEQVDLDSAKVIKSGSPIPVKERMPLSEDERQEHKKNVVQSEDNIKDIMQQYEQNLTDSDKRKELESELKEVFADHNYKESVKKLGIEALKKANAENSQDSH